MAGLTIVGQMKVSTLQKEFLNEFGLSLRIYDGREFADEEKTLGQVRKKKGSETGLSIAKNMKVGNLEDKFEEEFGLKVQIAGSDNSYLCKDELTLNAAQQEDEKKLARRARKEARGQQAGPDSEDEDEDEFDLDEWMEEFEADSTEASDSSMSEQKSGGISGFFSKIFGKKQSTEGSDEEDFDIEISWGDEPDLTEEDFKYNHCFLFYGLNEEAFSAIEGQIQDFDGVHHLSLLRSMEGVLITALCEQAAGSDKVRSLAGSPEELLAYVDQRLDQYIELIRDNYSSQIGEDCIDLIQLERPFLVDAISSAMKVWADSKHFESEDFIGAMIAFVKSSKSFDRRDSVSDEQDGMNLPVVTRSGFIRNCIYATEDIITVQYYSSDGEDDAHDAWQDGEGKNPRNACNYGVPFSPRAPFGFSYFDQDGQLWYIEDVGKAVTLASEWETDFLDPGEDAVEYHVSH